MSSSEILKFESDCDREVKLALRSWDERGKDPNMVLLSTSSWLFLLCLLVAHLLLKVVTSFVKVMPKKLFFFLLFPIW